MFTWHAWVPVQVVTPEVHPAKAWPNAGAALSVTVPLINFEQTGPLAAPREMRQLIPLGIEVTVPVPVPDPMMVSL